MSRKFLQRYNEIDFVAGFFSLFLTPSLATPVQKANTMASNVKRWTRSNRSTYADMRKRQQAKQEAAIAAFKATGVASMRYAWNGAAFAMMNGDEDSDSSQKAMAMEFYIDNKGIDPGLTVDMVLASRGYLFRDDNGKVQMHLGAMVIDAMNGQYGKKPGKGMTSGDEKRYRASEYRRTILEYNKVALKGGRWGLPYSEMTLIQQAYVRKGLEIWGEPGEGERSNWDVIQENRGVYWAIASALGTAIFPPAGVLIAFYSTVDQIAENKVFEEAGILSTGQFWGLTIIDITSNIIGIAGPQGALLNIGYKWIRQKQTEWTAKYNESIKGPMYDYSLDVW